MVSIWNYINWKSIDGVHRIRTLDCRRSLIHWAMVATQVVPIIKHTNYLLRQISRNQNVCWSSFWVKYRLSHQRLSFALYEIGESVISLEMYGDDTWTGGYDYRANRSTFECHLSVELRAQPLYSEIKHSDWPKLVMWLATSNHSQRRVVVLSCNLLMTSAQAVLLYCFSSPYSGLWHVP